tara:strand:- start:1218 stop:1502 length:285 start_codon:yes stop_codon:yes gene_type:complete
MKIPKTTEEEPYIEFRYSKNGKLKLSITSDWWGGKKEGFSCSDGSEGNTCLPKELKSHMKYFNEKKVKDIEKEMKILHKRLDVAKSECEYRSSM